MNKKWKIEEVYASSQQGVLYLKGTIMILNAALLKWNIRNQIG